MRFSAIDLQCNDIMWFATDRYGCVIALTGGGEGNIPEYVCRSMEETEEIEDYFINKAEEICGSTLLIGDNGSLLCHEAESLAKKGIFCFDVSSEPMYKHGYYKISVPDRPLRLAELPDNIRSMLCDHMIDVDVSREDHIMVEQCTPT